MHDFYKKVYLDTNFESVHWRLLPGATQYEDFDDSSTSFKVFARVTAIKKEK